MDDIRDVLTAEAVRSFYQPIVDLETGDVVGYEALARGPVGRWHTPDVLFACARDAGVLAELDAACRRAAFRGVLTTAMPAAATLFVNVEPEVLDVARLDELAALAAGAPAPVRAVFEITERALATHPAELLRTVERIRSFGWGVALDDVGAHPMSLAFMPLLRPDVVKLDLRLIQGRLDGDVAEIVHAVNAYAEESGAVVLAEGIETERHLQLARGLGARLGQGWLLGRPGPTLPPAATHAILPLTGTSAGPCPASPFQLLAPTVPVRTAPKRLLIALSKQLELQALRVGDTCVVASTFQERVHFTAATAERYRRLVAGTAFVCALGRDLDDEPVPGLRGGRLQDADPLLTEWDVAVLGPHFSAALLARDIGDTGPELDRTFEYALTYRRDTVVQAVSALISRVLPRSGPVAYPAGEGQDLSPLEAVRTGATGRLVTEAAYAS